MNPQAVKAESVPMTSPPKVSANPSTRTRPISITIYELQRCISPACSGLFVGKVLGGFYKCLVAQEINIE